MKKKIMNDFKSNEKREINKHFAIVNDKTLMYY